MDGIAIFMGEVMDFQKVSKALAPQQQEELQPQKAIVMATTVDAATRYRERNSGREIDGNPVKRCLKTHV